MNQKEFDFLIQARPFRSEDAGQLEFAQKVQEPLLYTSLMPQVTLDLPHELSTFLTASGCKLERAALQAIALEAYREGQLSIAQLRRVLGYHTRAQVHAFLKEHGVYLQYSLADLEQDRQAGEAIHATSTA